jgi:DivIVA domain-containing protein
LGRRHGVPLPDDGLTPGDLDGLRFDTALRGYRMSQVDAVIDRLRREIVDLEDRLDDRGDGAVMPIGAPATYTRPATEGPEASADPDAAPRTEVD